MVPYPGMPEDLDDDIQGPAGSGRTQDCCPAGDSICVRLSCRIIRAQGRGGAGGCRGGGRQDPAPPPPLPRHPHVSSAPRERGGTWLSLGPGPGVPMGQAQSQQEGWWARTSRGQMSRVPSAQDEKYLQCRGLWGQTRPLLFSLPSSPWMGNRGVGLLSLHPDPTRLKDPGLFPQSHVPQEEGTEAQRGMKDANTPSQVNL